MNLDKRGTGFLQRGVNAEDSSSAEKQLRIVHEIASLLGETAAETKLAVAQLKQTILEEENEQAGEAFSQNAFKSAKGGM